MVERLLVALVLVLVGASGQELPFADLGANSLALREKAEAEITGWAAENPEEAKKKLRMLYLRTDDPEKRRRLLRPLERAYFPPKGFVGIQMTSARFDEFGRLRNNGRADQEWPGVTVTAVVPDTPAEKSGLQVGDIILKINDWEVGSGLEVTDSVANEIQKNPPGAKVKLTVRRGKELKNLALKLGILPVPSERARSISQSSVVGGSRVSVEVLAQMEEFRQWLRGELPQEPKKTDR